MSFYPTQSINPPLVFSDYDSDAEGMRYAALISSLLDFFVFGTGTGLFGIYVFFASLKARVFQRYSMTLLLL